MGTGSQKRLSLPAWTQKPFGGLNPAISYWYRGLALVLPSKRWYNYRVCRRYGYIYIHIPKTAGESIEAILADLPRTRADWRHNYPTAKHARAVQTRRVVGPAFWESAFTFAFVRNPWDRIVSAYHWWLQSGPRVAQTKVLAKQVEDLGSFREFLVTYLDELAIETSDWVCDEDGKLMVDFVGRFENLADDWRTICERIPIPYTPLPHLNPSRRRDYHDYYDDETRALVAKRFRRSLETFGYEF